MNMFKINHAYAVYVKKNTYNGTTEMRITGPPVELGAHKTPTLQRAEDQDNEVSGSLGADVSSSAGSSSAVTSSGVRSIDQINEHASEQLGITISANTEMYIEEQDAASQPEQFESMDQFTPTSIITFKGPGISAVETAPPPNRNTNTMDVDDGMDETSSDAGNGDGTDDSQVSFDSLTSSDLQRAESDSDETPRSSKRRRR